MYITPAEISTTSNQLLAVPLNSIICKADIINISGIRFIIALYNKTILNITDLHLIFLCNILNKYLGKDSVIQILHDNTLNLALIMETFLSGHHTQILYGNTPICQKLALISARFLSDCQITKTKFCMVAPIILH